MTALIPTPQILVGFDAGAAESDYLVFDDPSRGLFDTGKFAPDDIAVDIGADARSIRCTRGSTRFEGVYARTEAGTFSAVLDNNTRKYDPNNTAGPYYPQVVPMRRVRLRAEYDTPSALNLLNGTVSTPDSVATSITGDIDVRARIMQSGYGPVIGKTDTATSGSFTELSWYLNFYSFPRGVGFFCSTDGGSPGQTGCTFFEGEIPDTDRPFWIRATRDANDGSGNAYIRAYYSLDDTNDHDTVTWIELAPSLTPTAPAGNLFDSNQPIRFGDPGLIDVFGTLSVLAAAVLDGIDGTAVANTIWHWDGDTVTGSGSTWVDATGLTWTINSPAYLVSPTAFDIWSGFADDWNLDYPGFGKDATTTLPATDGVKILSAYDGTEQSPAGSGEDAGARVHRVLDNANWPETDRDIDTGTTTLQSTTLAQNAWSELCLTADTEIGELYLTGAGKVRFRSRHAVVTDGRSRIARAVFGDADGELPITQVSPSSPGAHIKNFISAARVGGTAQTAEDVASQLAYQIRSLSRTDLLMEDDQVAADWADYVLHLLKDPDVEIGSFTVNARRDPDRLFPQVLGREYGDRVTIKLTPPGGGDRIVRDVFIRGIAHDVTPDSWITTFTCQDATPFSDLMIFDVGQFDTDAFGF